MCKAESGYSSIKAVQKSEAHDARTRKMDAIQGRAKTCKQILMTDLQASTADHISTSEASCMLGFYVLFQNASQSRTFPYNSVLIKLARSNFGGDKIEIQILSDLLASLERSENIQIRNIQTYKY